MGDVVLLVFLSVKINLVHIEVLLAQILRHHGECLSTGKIEGDGGKLGRTEDILGTDGIHRIESHGREHIPSRHLSAVVIAAQSVWLGKILGVEDFAHKFCRTFGTSCHGIEVYNVVARLVSVRILANESAHIAYGADQGNGEERIKFIQSRTSVSQYESENIMFALLDDIISTPEWNHLGIMLQYPLRLLVKSDAFLTEHEKDYTNRSWTLVDFVLYNKTTKLPVLVIEVDGMSFHKSGSEQSKRDALKNAALEKAHNPITSPIHRW